MTRLPPLLLGLICLVPACSSASWKKQDDVLKESYISVEIERRFEEGESSDQGYSHPANVDVKQLNDVLRSLRYKPQSLRGSSRPKPVIHQELTLRLAQAIAHGLRGCTSSDRVRFLVENPDKALFILPTSNNSRGVAFVKPEGVLNIAFDMVDDRPEADAINTWEDPTRRVVTRVEISGSRGANYRTSDGIRKSMWLTFDLASLPPVQPSTPTTTDADKPADPLAAPGEPEVVTQEEPPPTKTENPAKPASGLSNEEVLNRLRFLEQLFKNGKISKEDYEKTKEELLFPKVDVLEDD